MCDEEEDEFSSKYENGHWAWDDKAKTLVFVSDVIKVPSLIISAPKIIATESEFKELDLLEQLRYRKHYQRRLKPNEPDIITLQDVKDLAIYTAPVVLLSRQIIDLLHTATAERFLRALILYCQLYLQVSECMDQRKQELLTKIPTLFGERIEIQYRKDLCDIRNMVAKEYSILLIGAQDTLAFHHMGPRKTSKSQSNKDARFFESFLRVCIQIVWLALCRQAYNQIEVEVHRIFKSSVYNCVEHRLQTGYIEKMSVNERDVILGPCVKDEQKLTVHSPLNNEATCKRKIDYQLFGLGLIEYKKELMTPRLQYLLMAVSGPEALLDDAGVSVGILGLSRAKFDTTLVPIISAAVDAKTSQGSGVTATSKSAGNVSKKSSTASSKFTKSKSQKATKLYPDVALPEESSLETPFPPSFPALPAPYIRCNQEQHSRWLTRLRKLK